MKDTRVPDLPGYWGCCSKHSVLNQTNPQVLEQVTENTCQRGHYPLTCPVTPRRCQGRFEVMPAWATRALERCHVSAAQERKCQSEQTGKGLAMAFILTEPHSFFDRPGFWDTQSFWVEVSQRGCYGVGLSLARPQTDDGNESGGCGDREWCQSGQGAFLQSAGPPLLLKATQLSMGIDMHTQ